MASGAISVLGVGSGLELRDILEQLREADEAPIRSMEDEKTTLDEKVDILDALGAKFLAVKSHALTLSLESSFIERDVSSTNEAVLTADVVQGTPASSHTIEVTRLASNSSWQSDGVESGDAIVYYGTTRESEEGFTDTDTTSVISADSTLALSYGSESPLSISVDLTAGMTLDQIVNAINTDPENDDGEGSTYVTASTFTDEEGQYHLRVTSTDPANTADNQVAITTSPDDLLFSAPDAEFTYTMGSGGEPVTVSVSVNTTYNELVTLINEDENNAGITAALIDDGGATNPYRLVITADESGEDNRIGISGILSMTELNGAGGESLNASLLVNGIAYQRQTNTAIDNIIQGVTLNLQGEGTASVSITPNTESIQENVTGLVEKYNELIQEIRTQTSYDTETNTASPLFSSVGIKGLNSELNALIGTTFSTDSGGTISMYDLGMEINRDGTITLDSEVLAEKLSTGMDDVRTLFLGDDEKEVTGLGDLLNERLRAITSNNGILDLETQNAKFKIDGIETDIESTTERLDKKYEQLTEQFVQLDVYMNKMKSQSDYLSSVFASLNGSDNKK